MKTQTGLASCAVPDYLRRGNTPGRWIQPHDSLPRGIYELNGNNGLSSSGYSRSWNLPAFWQPSTRSLSHFYQNSNYIYGIQWSSLHLYYKIGRRRRFSHRPRRYRPMMQAYNSSSRRRPPGSPALNESISSLMQPGIEFTDDQLPERFLFVFSLRPRMRHSPHSPDLLSSRVSSLGYLLQPDAQPSFRLSLLMIQLVRYFPRNSQ